MRRLAAELDVTTNTVYWHVGSRDALIAEIIRTSATRLADRAITGTTPRERITAAARHIWDSALENRAITSLAHQTGTTAARAPSRTRTRPRDRSRRPPRQRRRPRPALDSLHRRWLPRGRPASESSSPAELRPAALWNTTSGGVSDETIQALSLPTDHEAVFTTTLDAVVAIHIPA